MEYLTVKELMDILKISRATAYKLINTDGFPAIRVGRAIRIDKNGLKNWGKRDQFL